jgi:hypothetical protein
MAEEGRQPSVVEKWAPIIATTAAIGAGCLYVLGSFRRSAYLNSFGIDGLVDWDLYSQTAAGAEWLSVSLLFGIAALIVCGGLVLGVFYFALWIWSRTTGGSFRFDRRALSSPDGGMVLAGAVALIVSLSATGKTMGMLEGYVTKRAASAHHHDFTYWTGSGPISGFPIAADKERLAVFMQPGERVAIIRWDTVRQVSRAAEGPDANSPKKAGPKANASETSRARLPARPPAAPAPAGPPKGATRRP